MKMEVSLRKILITNDDGIQSDGLIRLAKAAKNYGQVWIVAPDGQRSAMSHTINLREAITATKVEFPVEGVNAYACSGTPADCVRIGVLNIVPGGPDNVFSGINYGYNVATDLQYSATAGAAFEASFQGIHTIAFSENADDCHEVTDKYLEQIIEELLEENIPYNQIMNVNFPGCKISDCKGILRDRTVSDDVFYADKYNETIIDENTVSYMVEGIRNWEATEGTDLRAILDNYISIGLVKNVGA